MQHLQYNDQLLEFLVMEVKPGNAVSIIECDMNVEFDAPEGYVEPSTTASSSNTAGKVLKNVIVNKQSLKLTVSSKLRYAVCVLFCI